MKPLIGLLLVLTTTVVNASEWIRIATNDYATIYININTIRKKGDKVEAWTMDDWKQPFTVGEFTWLSRKYYAVYDCVNKTLKPIVRTAYSGNMGRGNIIGSINEPEPEKSISPNSLADITLRFLCEQHKTQ